MRWPEPSSAEARPSRQGALGTALVASLLFGGYCGDPGKTAMEVENETRERLAIFYVDEDGNEVRIGSEHSFVPPGRSVPFKVTIDGEKPECTPGAVVARNEAGTEVARREEPLCQEELWVINE